MKNTESAISSTKRGNSANSLVAYSIAFLLAGMMLSLVDIILTALSREMFFDTSEMLLAMLYILGINISTGIVFGWFVIAIVGVFNAIVKAFGFKDSTVWKNAATSAVLLGPFIYILLQLTSGPKARMIPGRIAVVFFSAAVLSIITSYLLIVVLPWIRNSSIRKKFALVSLICIAVFLSIIDAYVFVRLYPLFHTCLTLVALILLGTALLPFFDGFKKIMLRVIGFAVVILFLVLGIASFVMVFRTQNIRFVIGETAVAASDFISFIPRFILRDELEDKNSDLKLHGPGSAENFPISPKSSVFLITVDAMRYDRLKYQGAGRSVAPNIDVFAESAVKFRRAYTSTPHTSYAITSLMTGKYIRSLVDVPGVPSIHETWPEIMRRFHYDTAGFFTPAVFFIDKIRFEPYLRSGLGFTHRILDPSQTAEQRVSALESYLNDKKDSNRSVFAWIHFFEPHEPYDPLCTKFGTSPVDRYDCEIWTVDQALGKLLKTIEDTRPDSIVIITADHGEEFGDHGGHYHGTSLYDEQVRVPLLMKIPKVSPRTVEAPVSLTDLLGTVLNIVDIPPPARVRSRDLTGVIWNKEVNIDAFAELHDESMLVFDNHKIICNSKADLCRLYDLQKDPGETVSISEQNPDLLLSMKSRLSAWRQSHAAHELRPVSEEKGANQWPEPIRRALSGESVSISELLTVVFESNKDTVKRKAASLAFGIAESYPHGVSIRQDEQDIETAAWVNALLAKFGDKEALSALKNIVKKLEPETEVFRVAAAVRLEAGDTEAYDDVMSTALNKKASIEERKTALRILSGAERRIGLESLIPLIDNYQIALEAAACLGKLQIKAAIPKLAARLKRERFMERKAAIIDSLASLGDWKAVAAIADELYEDNPPQNTLKALSEIVATSPYGRKLSSDHKERQTLFFKPAPSAPFRVYIKRIFRMALRTTSDSEGGTVTISCNGMTMGQVPFTSGAYEGYVDLSSCKKKQGEPYELKLKVESSSSEAKVLTAVVLGK